MKETRVRSRLRERWTTFAALLTTLLMIGLLAHGVWRQVHRLQELRAAEAALRPIIAREQERNEQLRREDARTASPDYVEEWARTQAGMVRPGEVRLVAPPPEPTAEITPTPSPPVTQFWHSLWQQLIGQK